MNSCYIVIIFTVVNMVIDAKTSFMITYNNSAHRRGVLDNNLRECERFFYKTLPELSINELSERLTEKKFDMLISMGRLDKITSYFNRVSDEHQVLSKQLLTSILLPSTLNTLVQEYYYDGLYKGVLIRDYFLSRVNCGDEMGKVLASKIMFPRPSLSLLFDIFFQTDQSLMRVMLGNYIDVHYPREDYDAVLETLIEMVFNCYDLDKRIDCFSWLFNRGISIDKQYGKNKITLLHMAIDKRYVNLTKYFLSCGANIDLPDHNEFTVRHLLNKVGWETLLEKI